MKLSGFSRLTKKERERTQINKIINERGDITADTTQVESIMRLLWTIIYSQTGQPRRNVKFLETYYLWRLNHEEIDNLNRPFTSKKLNE